MAHVFEADAGAVPAQAKQGLTWAVPPSSLLCVALHPKVERKSVPWVQDTSPVTHLSWESQSHTNSPGALTQGAFFCCHPGISQGSYWSHHDPGCLARSRRVGTAAGVDALPPWRSIPNARSTTSATRRGAPIPACPRTPSIPSCKRATAICGWAPTEAWSASTASTLSPSTPRIPRSSRAIPSPTCFRTASGTLWISTAAGLVSYRGGAFAAYTTAQGLPADTVWFSYEDQRHRLWAITSAGPAWFNGKSFVAGRGSPVRGPAPSPRAGGGRARNALAGRQQRRLGPRYHARHAAPGLAPAQRRRRWKRSSSTAREMSGSAPAKDWNAMPAARSPPSLHLPGKTEVTALYPDADGGMWVGTATGMLHVAARRRPAPTRDQRLEVRSRGWSVRRPGAGALDRDRTGCLPAPGRPASVLRPGFPVGGQSGAVDVRGPRRRPVAGHRFRRPAPVARSEVHHLHHQRRALRQLCALCLSKRQWRAVDRHRRGGVESPHQHRLRPLLDRRRPVQQRHPFAGRRRGRRSLDRHPQRAEPAPPGHGCRNSPRPTACPTTSSAPSTPTATAVLWIGTRHGLAHLAGGKFTSFSSMDGLGSDFIGAILRSGLAPNAWARLDRHFRRPEPAAERRLHQLHRRSRGSPTTPSPPSPRTPQGTLWLGTNGGGLNRLRAAGRSRPFPPVPRGCRAPSTACSRTAAAVSGSVPKPGSSGFRSPSCNAYAVGGGPCHRSRRPMARRTA